MLLPESLKLQKNGTYRWNLTLSNDLLHVSHRKGYEPVEKFLAARLITEESSPVGTKGINTERVSLRTQSYEGIVEGIARESVVLSRSRSALLRREALRLSAGVCEGGGVDYSFVLNGRGLRVLQVHHKKQLALRDTPEATSLEDLAVVCANCHAIIHTNLKEAMSVETLREQWFQDQTANPLVLKGFRALLASGVVMVCNLRFAQDTAVYHSKYGEFAIFNCPWFEKRRDASRCIERQ